MDKTIHPFGIFPDVSNADYHGGPGVSKSGLDLIRKSPAHYYTAKKYPRPQTPAMALGSALHCLVLEPLDFPNRFIMEPLDAPRRPTAAQVNAKKPSQETVEAIEFWMAWDKAAAGKTCIGSKPGDNAFWNPSEWDRLVNMANAIKDHPIASVLLSPVAGQAEQSVYWTDETTRELCKCRPDFLNEDHNVIVDLKSTEDASFSGFGKSVAAWRYHVQDAFYSAGLAAVGRKTADFIFVAVEKTPPYCVGVYTLSPDARRAGRIQMYEDLAKLAECKAANQWPTYPPEVRQLELSNWQMLGKIA